ncbi:16S rRNA (cytidine(1402)-2'-O)-methyltransferase [Candidatus Nitrospira bockiana]
MPGTLYVVATPIGNPDDLTPRARRVLAQVHVIAAETPSVTRDLLDRYGIAADITSYQQDNKETKTAVILARLREGRDAALVCDAGTPVVADPGAYLVGRTLAAGFPVVPVPGPSALVAALSVSGFSGDEFTFLGLMPDAAAARRRLYDAVTRALHTTILFASGARLPVILDALRLRIGARRIVLAANLTTADEVLVRGSASDLLHGSAAWSLKADDQVTILVEGRRRAEGRKSSPRRVS